MSIAQVQVKLNLSYYLSLEMEDTSETNFRDFICYLNAFILSAAGHSITGIGTC